MIIGIDPGASGGLACFNEERQGEVWAFSKLTEHDLAEVVKALSGAGVFAFIERVHSMPKQGVASSFKFGDNAGFLRGLLVANSIPFEQVVPSKWQKYLGCLSGGNKNVTKARAQQLYPHIRVTHGIADAILIAEYGLRVKGEVAYALEPTAGQPENRVPAVR